MQERDVVVAAARHQVGWLPTEELPMLAAVWLADGLDTPTLRELAGLGRRDRSAAGLWPEVVAELGVDLPVVDPRRVLAPWAARLVLAGEHDTAWLVDNLLRGIPVDDHDDLVSMLHELDQCVETLAQPYARRVQDLAAVLTEARTRAARVVWLLARLDPRDELDPLPPMPRDEALLEAAARALRDDLRRITRRRWTLDETTPGSWVVSSPDRSAPLQVDPVVDSDALPPQIGSAQVSQEFADEAIALVGDAVAAVLDGWGAEVRCRTHGTTSTVCAGVWVCDSHPGHDIAEVGSLRRRHAAVHVAE